MILRIGTDYINLNELFDPKDTKTDFFWLLDESHFEVIRIAKGRKQMLSVEMETVT